MKYIVENWFVIVGLIAVLAAGGYAIYVFVKMPSDKQLNKVREWLLYAVTKAEKELGGGTGQIKLRYVYDMFVTRFAWLIYYSKVPWKKGTFVSNTGRKAKNTQDIMIFSKGKARNMRFDKKKSDMTGEKHYMSGCNGMLPTMFDVQPVARKNKIHQSELPVELCEKILEYVTYEGEIVLDSFAGSGAVGVAALNKKRSCILIEILKENIEKIKTRFNSDLYQAALE